MLKSKPEDEPPAFGPCRLCRVPSVLQWSHIVPRWTYRRIVHTNPAGGANPVMVRDDEARLGGEQYAEYLLCRRCEARVGLWDRHVAELALQPNGKFPAVERAPLIGELSGRELQVVDLSALNVGKIALFAASVIWRASISRTFARVRLGPYEDPIRNYLLDDGSSFPAFARLFVHIIRPDERTPVDRIVAMPYAGRQDRYHTHRFALFGFLFSLFVGGELPAVFDEACVVKTRRGLIDDGSLLIPDLAAMFARVRMHESVQRLKRK